MSKRRNNIRRRNSEITAIKDARQTSALSAQKGKGMLPLWLPVVPALIIGEALWLGLSAFPEMERMMEALNFFVWTPEFVVQKLATYPGITTLVNDWLLQFCKNPSIGIAIEAILLSLMTLFAAFLPFAWGRKGWAISALVPAVGISCISPHCPSMVMQAIFFFVALIAFGVVCRKCRHWLASLVIVITGLLSVWILAFPIAVCLFVLMTLLQMPIKSHGSSKWLAIVNIVLPLMWIAITIIFVKWSSITLGFIALDMRWWYMADCVGDEWIMLLLLIAPLAAMYIPCKLKTLWQFILTIVASVVAAVYLYLHITDNEQSRQSEEVYHFSSLAERGEWQELLSEINGKGAIENNLYLQFALLAEARLGTLADNLFLYPINSPEVFCPRLHDTPINRDLCRIFYRELGFIDEAYHQAFQYGVMASRTNGFCAASLRHMAEYAVKMGDKPLAEKYIYLLERTSNNDELAKQFRAQLAQAEVKTDSVPLRANNFVKAYAFTSEMAHFLDYDRNNRAALDYLLCGLLLTKQLELFKTVLNDFVDVYKDNPLPRAYAEAAAMIHYLQPMALSPDLHYDTNYDEQFRQFTELRNAKADDSAFRGTFWYYYVYAQIPPMQNWIDQSQSS